MSAQEQRIEQYELRFKKFAHQQMVAMELLLEPEASIAVDMVMDTAVMRLTTRVLADDLPPEHFEARQYIAYEVPSSTWQAWKARHARRWYAAWLVRRRPVRYELDPDGRGINAVCSFDLLRFRAYPQARIERPRDRFGQATLHHMIQGPWWNEEPRDGAGENRG